MSNAQQVYSDSSLLEELIALLLNETELSHRQIASLIGVGRYKVHFVNRKLKEAALQ